MSLYELDVRNGRIIHTPALLLFRWAGEDRQGMKRREMLTHEKINQGLGFVPLITAPSLAGDRKK